MPYQDLKRFAETVGDRHGWDFSAVREDIDPTPWDYLEVVRRYLRPDPRPDQRVLDVGTGGGEKFLALAERFNSGVGVDVSAAMIAAAQANTPPDLADNVRFQQMRAEALDFPNERFHLVLNRHSVVHPPEIMRVLKPGGVFITQQVGARNTHNICQVFDCDVGGRYLDNPEQDDDPQDLEALAETFRGYGGVIVATGEYDVGYYFQDVESFIFWLKAIPMPEDFDIERHWRQVDKLITHHSTPRGIQTNEHRELLIVRKV